MVSKIQVVVEGNTDSLTEAFEAGKLTIEEFEESLEQLSSGTKPANEVIEELGKIANKTNEELMDFVNQASDAEFDSLIDEMGKAEQGLADIAQKEKQASVASQGLNLSVGQLVKGFIGITTAYAAGRAVTRFIKDSIDLARASGKEGAALDLLESEWSRLKAVAGTIFLKVTAEGVQNAIGFISRYADSLSFATASEQSLERAGVRRVAIMETINRGGLLEKEIETQFSRYEDLEGQLLQTSEASQMWADQAIEGAKGVSIASEGAMDAIEGMLESSQRFTQADRDRLAGERLMGQIAEDSRAAEQAIEDANRAYDEFFRDLTEGFGSFETDALIKGLRFEAAGGDALLDIEQQIKDALEGGLILPVKALELLEDLKLETLDLAVSEGNITELEAIASLAGALGIDLKEAKEKWEDFKTAVEGGIDKNTVPDFVEIMQLGEASEEVGSLLFKLQEADRLAVKPDVEEENIKAAEETALNLLTTLESISSQKFKTVVEIELKLTGDTGAAGGQNASGGGAFAGVPVIVGDAGTPELFTPSQSGSIQPIGAGANINNRYNQIFSAPITINVGGEGGSLAEILAEPIIG